MNVIGVHDVKFQNNHVKFQNNQYKCNKEEEEQEQEEEEEEEIPICIANIFTGIKFPVLNLCFKVHLSSGHI